jgi:hypothetical protein
MPMMKRIIASGTLPMMRRPVRITGMNTATIIITTTVAIKSSIGLLSVGVGELYHSFMLVVKPNARVFARAVCKTAPASVADIGGTDRVNGLLCGFVKNHKITAIPNWFGNVDHTIGVNLDTPYRWLSSYSRGLSHNGITVDSHTVSHRFLDQCLIDKGHATTLIRFLAGHVAVLVEPFLGLHGLFS